MTVSYSKYRYTDTQDNLNLIINSELMDID